MRKPDIAIVVCTYRRPENLRRVLASIAGQRGVDGRFEVVVADDGSDDETAQVCADFARRSRFPLQFVTHPHEGFCPGRCRNEGVAASEADYLLLLDGDCIIPPDHVRIHLEKRRPGVVRLGDHVRLSQAESDKITADAALRGDYRARWSMLIASRMWRKAAKASWYKLTRNKSKPRLTSNNVGIWRGDYEAVNGFDENYVGWGCEDDDMGIRLRRAGLRLETILWWTWAYHLWHPPVSSMPMRWKDGENVAYFSRGFHLVRCGNGLVKRLPKDLKIALAGEWPSHEVLSQVLPRWCQSSIQKVVQNPEVEILFAPNNSGFSGRAQCNVLVLADSATKVTPRYTQANLVLAAEKMPHWPAEHQFELHQFDNAIHFLLTNSDDVGLSLRKRRPTANVLRPAA